jgi:hypothetical protein
MIVTLRLRKAAMRHLCAVPLFMVIAGASPFGCAARPAAQPSSRGTNSNSADATEPAPHPSAATAEAAVPALAIDNEVRQPATVAEAAQAIDLSTFPLMDGAKPPTMRVVASLGYEVAADAKSAFEFQRRTLLDMGWKELAPPQIYDQSASGQFSRNGFYVSVSVFSRGEPGQVSVRLQNHSNLNLAKLPVPPGAKLQYAFPAVTSFVTGSPVEETTEAVRKLLLDQGWQPYGSAGDAMTFKKNAVELQARLLAPPAQPGKTVIDYSATQMSADLPAPADAEHVQYSDQLKQLNLNAPGTPDEVAAYYQAALAPAGWKSTTEKLVKDGVASFMIFRNPGQEMLTLNMWDLRDEKQVRVTLNHQSAAEVEELDRKAKLLAEESKRKLEAERSKTKPKVVIRLPAEARDVKAGKEQIEVHLASGKAKAAVEAIVKELTSAGWKVEESVGDNMAGQIALKKSDQSVRILYVDPGIIPAQITVSGRGIELERHVQQD